MAYIFLSIPNENHIIPEQKQLKMQAYMSMNRISYHTQYSSTLYRSFVNKFLNHCEKNVKIMW